MSTCSNIEAAKRLAAHKAVDEHFLPLLTKDDGNDGKPIVLGIGSGSTIVFAVDRLCQLNKSGQIKNDFVCIPTSFQARQLILDNQLILGDLEQYPEVEVTLDGADEVDLNLNCIKGGGGCQTQEKIVAYNSKKLVIVADYRKDSKILGQAWKKGVPIEVLPMAYKPIMKTLQTRFGAQPLIRMAEAKAGPCITDNGNMIIDADFGAIEHPERLNAELKMIPGVVETGLFINMAKIAYFGMEDGTTKMR